MSAGSNGSCKASARRLAILFWFYKEPAVCENRLDIVARHNGDLPIYGLFGGPPGEAAAFEARLGARLDDFYAAPPGDPQWKWLNGDLMLLDWYERRGRSLVWEQVAIVQWDMLVLGGLRDQFPGLQPGQMSLPHLRRLSEADEAAWYWTSGRRGDYLQFRQHIRETRGYDQQPFGCGFMFAIIPRAFFEHYGAVAGKEIGFLEYKLPTYADLFGIPFYEKDFGVGTAMNAINQPIARDFIHAQLAKVGGWRLFHPYYAPWEVVR
jgi:hypothetical protein